MSKKTNGTTSDSTPLERDIDTNRTENEVFAAIAMALHEMQDEVHDPESLVLTISPVRQNYSPWSSKIYTLSEIPNRK
jgi:hypothetical protein